MEYAPFKPSLLRFSSGPTSPTLPLKHPGPHPFKSVHSTSLRPHQGSSKPPPAPPPWMWTCHCCHKPYALGVTRRCLEDGHMFCTGRTSLVTGQKTAERSCNSSFDYTGWAEWQIWRRGIYDGGPQSYSPGKKHCWMNCDFPSECRWSHRFKKAQTAVVVTRGNRVRTEVTVIETEVKAETMEYEKEADQTTIVVEEVTAQEPDLLDGSDEPGSPEEDEFDDVNHGHVSATSMLSQIAMAIPLRPKNPLALSLARQNRTTDIKEEADLDRLSGLVPPVSPLKQHYLLPPAFDHPFAESNLSLLSISSALSSSSSTFATSAKLTSTTALHIPPRSTLTQIATPIVERDDEALTTTINPPAYI